MKSVSSVNQLVDQFSSLIKKYALDTEKAQVENLLFKPSLSLGTPKPGDSLKNVETFTKFLVSYQDFTTLLPSGEISIGASIDVPNESASVYVSSPKKFKNLENANQALNNAFMKHYGMSPVDAIKNKKSLLLKEMKQNPSLSTQESLNAKAQNPNIVSFAIEQEQEQ